MTLPNKVFTDSFCDWVKSPPSISPFAKAHYELRQQQDTAECIGFNTANSVLASTHKDITYALQKYACATTMNKKTK